MNIDIEGTGASAMRPTISLVAGLFVFILLYNPTFAVIDASLLRLVVLYGVVAGVVSGNWLIWSRSLVDHSLFLIGSFAVAFGGAQAIAMLGGGDITFGALMLACLTGYIPAAYVVARHCDGKFGRVGALLRLVALAGALQAVCIVLDWISPTVHGLFSSIVVQPDLSKVMVRAAGLSSSAGDGLAFTQTFGAMSASYLALTAEQRPARLGWAVVVALCLASMMFAARTGFVMIAVFFLVMGTSRTLALGVARTLAVTTLVVLAGVAVAITLLPFDQAARLGDRVLPYAFEFAYSYLSGEGFRTLSTDDLQSMLFLPSDTATLLFGSGYFGDPIDGRFNYMGTDIGYVRTIYYVGLVGSALIYSWFLLFWRELRSAATTPVLRRFIDASFIVLFVAHAKFPFLFLGTGMGLMFALFFAFRLEREPCASAA